VDGVDGKAECKSATNTLCSPHPLSANTPRRLDVRDLDANSSDSAGQPKPATAGRAGWTVSQANGVSARRLRGK